MLKLQYDENKHDLFVLFAWENKMLLEVGLFSGDNLLHQGVIKVTEIEQLFKNEIISVSHQLVDEYALIELQIFEQGVQQIESILKMPVHQSEDWESIKLANYTLVFRCMLNT